MENHTLSIDNREKLTITSVADVESANEETVLVILTQGGLIVKG